MVGGKGSPAGGRGRDPGKPGQGRGSWGAGSACAHADWLFCQLALLALTPLKDAAAALAESEVG